MNTIKTQDGVTIVYKDWGGIKAHYDGIVALSQTDFVPDLKKISVPTLVMHGDDDQIVPYADSGPLSAKLLKNGILKTYKGFPLGCQRPKPKQSTLICWSSSGVSRSKVQRECAGFAKSRRLFPYTSAPTIDTLSTANPAIVDFGSLSHRAKYEGRVRRRGNE